MSDTPHHAAEGHAHDEKHYIKIWGILMVLLLISIFGPFIGVWIITLITAFGVAGVKAYLVAKHFMHLNVEKPIVWYFVGSCLVIMVVFFAAVSPDVMNHEGRNWDNVAAKMEVDRQMKLGAGGAEHGAHAPAGGEHAPAGGEHAPAGGEHAPAGEGAAQPAGGHP